MMKGYEARLGVLFMGVLSCAPPPEPPDDGFVFQGASDASAAVAIAPDRIFVGDDENNALRVYDTRGGRPLLVREISPLLDAFGDHPEADIEGAAKVGDRVYWITSHGRSARGDPRPNRYRFFGVDVLASADGSFVIEPVGSPHTTLAQEMVESAAMEGLGLYEATRLDDTELSDAEVKSLAPKKEGLNIEGLCAAPDGSVMFIGLRNPRPIDPLTGREQAIIARLKNFAEVVADLGSPVFDPPLLWDLDGKGVRSFEYSARHQSYFIVAGGVDDALGFAFYRWSGAPAEQPEKLRDLDLGDLRPEALVAFDDRDEMLLLSDDGTRKRQISVSWECMEGKLNKDDTCPNKFLTDPDRKTSRGAWITP